MFIWSVLLDNVREASNSGLSEKFAEPLRGVFGQFCSKDLFYMFYVLGDGLHERLELPAGLFFTMLCLYGKFQALLWPRSLLPIARSQV